MHKTGSDALNGGLCGLKFGEQRGLLRGSECLNLSVQAEDVRYRGRSSHKKPFVEGLILDVAKGEMYTTYHN